MPKTRLDALMVARGLAESRDWAQRLIRAGEVRVNGQVIDAPARLVLEAVEVVVAQPPRYVSRGGFKLEAALDHFGIDPAGRICADAGSSTGGFTDCLLQRGATRVYAVDVGTNQLHWRLRQDPRVVVRERENARYLDALPEPISLAVTDVSFISLTMILPQVFKWMSMVTIAATVTAAEVVALIKPQFEAGRAQVGRGGIVRDPDVHAAVVEKIVSFAAGCGWPSRGVIDSPLLGADGNREFLVWLGRA